MRCYFDMLILALFLWRNCENLLVTDVYSKMVLCSATVKTFLIVKSMADGDKGSTMMIVGAVVVGLVLLVCGLMVKCEKPSKSDDKWKTNGMKWVSVVIGGIMVLGGIGIYIKNHKKATPSMAAAGGDFPDGA